MLTKKNLKIPLLTRKTFQPRVKELAILTQRGYAHNSVIPLWRKIRSTEHVCWNPIENPNLHLASLSLHLASFSFVAFKSCTRYLEALGLKSMPFFWLSRDRGDSHPTIPTPCTEIRYLANFGKFSFRM